MGIFIVSHIAMLEKMHSLLFIASSSQVQTNRGHCFRFPSFCIGVGLISIATLAVRYTVSTRALERAATVGTTT